jgi:hypothetical protein
MSGKPDECEVVSMASIRKRTWKSGGKDKAAWVADYFDQHGKRHQVAFETKKQAADELARIQVDVQRGIHTPESASITVAEAVQLWLDKGALEKLERSKSWSARPCGSTVTMPICTSTR